MALLDPAMKPLQLVPANDPINALLALGNVLGGSQGLFITSPEVNGVLPEVHGLPEAVEEKVGLIVESSGSTGTPKRLELSAKALTAAAKMSAKRLGGNGQWLLALPINFVAGAMVLVRSLIADTQPVLMNTSMPFTAEAFTRSASLMTGERRYTSLVPTQLDRLFQVLDSEPGLLEALQRFDAILIGGQKPNRTIINALRKKDINIVTTYGMAETCGGVVYNGEPLDGVEISILEDDRIAIESPTLASNVKRPYITSDLGQFTDGKLYVKGRADRVVVSGAHKLSLESVEEWTMKQTGVVSAAAVSTTHPKFGESFVCFLTLGDATSFDAAKAHFALGVVAKSGEWKVLEKLPTLMSGKPDLIELTELAAKLGGKVGQA
ncbi:MAG: AMP-binding protein [Rhodoluna sp.]|nr:AMP-binding protein [Rhodoluna sp.]